MGSRGLSQVCPLPAPTHRLHGFNLDDFELRKLARILAVVRKIVMARADAFDGGRGGGAGEHDGDQPRGAGLEGKLRSTRGQ